MSSIIRNKNIMETTLLLASMLTILANAIIAPALPLISLDFKEVESIELLSKMMLTLPALTIAVSAPIIGRFLNKVGRVKMLFGSLLVYLIAGTSGYWLNNLYTILIGRFVFGIGVAGIMTVSTTLIGDYFTGAKRERFMGLQGAFVALGGLIFITAAGYLTDISWKLTFLVYAFSIVVLVLVPFTLYEPETDKATSTANATEDSSVSKLIWLVYIAAFITTVSFYVIPTQLPFFLQKLEGMDGNKMGLALGSLPLAQSISSFLYKKVKSKLTFMSIVSLGFLPMTIGFIIIGLSTTYWQAIAGIMACGLGVGLLIPNVNLWVVSLAPIKVRGKYVGYLTTAMFVGMFLSPAIIQPIQKAVGMNESFIVLGVAMAILSACYLLIKTMSSKKISA
nr:MFS transporter [uncultured Carboxylicivirga sp.]